MHIFEYTGYCLISMFHWRLCSIAKPQMYVEYVILLRTYGGMPVTVAPTRHQTWAATLSNWVSLDSSSPLPARNCHMDPTPPPPPQHQAYHLSYAKSKNKTI